MAGLSKCGKALLVSVIQSRIYKESKDYNGVYMTNQICLKIYIVNDKPRAGYTFMQFSLLQLQIEGIKLVDSPIKHGQC